MQIFYFHGVQGFGCSILHLHVTVYSHHKIYIIRHQNPRFPSECVLSLFSWASLICFLFAIDECLLFVKIPMSLLREILDNSDGLVRYHESIFFMKSNRTTKWMVVRGEDVMNSFRSNISSVWADHKMRDGFSALWEEKDDLLGRIVASTPWRSPYPFRFLHFWHESH